ncbi:MAG TPA: S24 family peptidase [Gemmatimonadaceae bacterium]|nr:S24 family peptidase [Gemmatimonadaceae bacterium]
MELLAQIVGCEATRNPEHPIWRDDRFLDWLAREARARAERDQPISDSELRRRGDEMLARVQARRLAVLRRGAPPVLDVDSSPYTVKEEAALQEHRVREHAQSRRRVGVIDLGIAAGIGRDLWDEVVEKWVELPPDVPPGRYIAMSIVGDSMVPLMHTGDIVLVRLESNVRRDRIIVARHPENGYVCKCIRRVRRDVIELGSIAPDGPAMTIPRDPACIVGTVAYIWCSHLESGETRS